MSENSELETRLSQLSPEDARIFQFHRTELEHHSLDKLPGEIGSTMHLKFVEEHSSKNPEFQNTNCFIKSLKRQTFANEAARMVNLALACEQNGKQTVSFGDDSQLQTFTPSHLFVPAVKARRQICFHRTVSTPSNPQCPNLWATLLPAANRVLAAPSR
jgi:hypothetical protein